MVTKPIVFLVVRRQVLPKDKKGTGPLLQSLLVVQPIHQTQKKGSGPGGAGPSVRPLTVPLPAYVSNLRQALKAASLEAATMLYLGPLLGSSGVSPELESETFLIPTRLVASPDGSSLIVLLDLVPSRRLLQSTSIGSTTVAEGEAAGATASPLVYLLFINRPIADGRKLALVHCGVACDAAFLSPRHLALLTDGGQHVSKRLSIYPPPGISVMSHRLDQRLDRPYVYLASR